MNRSAIWIAFFSLFVGACATAPHRKAMQVEAGMSKQAVLEAAGKPLDRSFKGAQERWVYGAEEEGAPRKIVVFRAGKVVSLENEAPSPAGGSAPVAVIPADGAIADLPCADKNQFGSFAEGGGCNMYGCYPPGGYCNNWGCSAQGNCTAKHCPKKIESYRCVE